jgi:hypothetical protein
MALSHHHVAAYDFDASNMTRVSVPQQTEQAAKSHVSSSAAVVVAVAAAAAAAAVT